jgi:hypothetical protein
LILLILQPASRIAEPARRCFTIARLLRSLITGLRAISIGVPCCLLPSQPAYAWSAVVASTTPTSAGGGGFGMALYRIWSSFIRFISRQPDTVIKEVGTHQLMIKLASQRLEKDPACIDQEGCPIRPMSLSISTSEWYDENS